MRVSRWPESGRLSLLLWAAGALIGLGAAGFALFTAKGTATSTVPPEYIATVNQRPVYLSDYLDQLQAQFNVTMETASVEQRRKVLDDMIREELFVRRGLELDEPGIDPDVRNALVAAVQSQIAVDATSQTPTEAELAAFYRQHLERYSSIGYLLAADLIAPGDPSGAKGAAALAAAHEPGVALAMWLHRYTEYLATKRGLAAALHSGDPAYGALPGYFRQRLGPALGSLLEAAIASGEIRADISPEYLLRAVANLCLSVADEGAAYSQRMVALLIDGLRYGAADAGRNAEDAPG